MLKGVLALASTAIMMLSVGCSQQAGKPEAPPPAGKQAVEVSTVQSALLEKVESVSVNVCCTLDDASAEIARQATARGLPYYRIVSLMQVERLRRDNWRGYAIFYRLSPAHSPHQSDISSR